jgi:transcriptional regulator with PAS, ATPase and Fis domain
MGLGASALWSVREAITADRLRQLVERHGGHLGPVAEHLGVSVRTVQRWMKEFGLIRGDFR